MTEDRIPTEQELDALLSETPQFDLEAVKHRTLSRIAPPQKARKRLPLRGLCIAAVVCALSVSAVAAGYAGDGGIVKMLSSIRKPQVEEYAADPLPDPEPTPIVTEKEEPQPAPAPEPIPEPEPEPEPPVLDEKIAAALEVTPEQAEKLRPAVQNVDLTTQDKDITMTVLQTVGDAHRLFLTVRFDFPEAVPIADDLEFWKLQLHLDKSTSLGYSTDILERTETSVTYLFKLQGTDEPLLGQTMTVQAEDYGRDTGVENNILTWATGEEVNIIHPDRRIETNATEEQLAALTSPVARTETPAEGFTFDYLEDGTIVVYYDGTQGEQCLTIFPEEPSVSVGNLRFDTVIEGSWTLSWVLDYDALSLEWTGETVVFENAPPFTEITISPFGWRAVYPWDETKYQFIPETWEAQLRHADGTLTDFPMKQVIGHARYDNDHVIAQLFDEPLELSDVTAIIINGVEFPLSSK